MTVWYIIIGSLLGAATFRLRGDAIVARVLGKASATTEGRLIWAVPLSIFATLIAWDWRLLALAPALFLGCLPRWWNSFDLGRGEGTWTRDAFVLTLRGVWWTLPPGVVLGALDYDWWFIPFGGLAAVPAYEAGWQAMERLHWSNALLLPTELFYGAALGAGLALAIAA